MAANEKNFDVTVTFKADVFADCNKTSLYLNDVIAEAFETNKERYVEVYHNNIDGQIVASEDKQLYPVIKAGTVITFNSISEDDYEMYLQPEIELLHDYESKNPIPYTDIEKYVTIEKVEATNEAEQTNEQELEEKREQAQQKFNELVNKELKEEKEKEQKAKEELGFDKLFTIEEIKQNNRTHYFVIFNEKVDYEKYKKLEALVHFYNGKYHVENEKRGFYFKSAKSKDNFMNVTSLEMTADQKKKFAKRQAYEAMNSYEAMCK
jgi:hypothetical protein